LLAGAPVRRQRHVVGLAVDAGLDRGGGTVVGRGRRRRGRCLAGGRTARPRNPGARGLAAELLAPDGRPQPRCRRLRRALKPDSVGRFRRNRLFLPTSGYSWPQRGKKERLRWLEG